MLADMPIEPFDPFPKELHVRRQTHMTFITCDIITDSTDYLVVRYRAGRGYHDTTEQLIVYVSVKMFYQ